MNWKALIGAIALTPIVIGVLFATTLLGYLAVPFGIAFFISFIIYVAIDSDTNDNDTPTFKDWRS